MGPILRKNYFFAFFGSCQFLEMIDPGYKIMMVNPIIIDSVELVLLYLFSFLFSFSDSLQRRSILIQKILISH